MAGFDKSEITLKFDKGYLTVSAKKTDKQEEGKYIRRERALQLQQKLLPWRRKRKEHKGKV